MNVETLTCQASDLKPLSTAEVARLLSKDKHPRSFIPPKLAQQIELTIEQYRPLLEPRAVYTVLEPNTLPNRPCFVGVKVVGLAICTIGPALPRKVQELMGEGQLSKGVTLDAVGSVFVEALADKVDGLLGEKARELGLVHSRRFSPGYCGWSVVDQQLFFTALPADSIGVTLSNSYLMDPVKTVTFAKNFSPDLSSVPWNNRCRSCAEDRCSYRCE